ncbi:MAG: hypothetical protein KA437_08430, partial [Fermentimonas sp.]|nr:hypothetical protein [Fermentimonas sp.]
IKSSDEDFDPAVVRFEFDESKLASYKYFIGETEYSVAKKNLTVSEDGSKLLLGEDVAATLEDDLENGYKLYLDTDGTEATNAAKALIGQRVPVKLVTELCDTEEPVVKTIKSFEVFFIEPIAIDAKLSGSFTDAVINGSRISVSTALTFTDWNNYVVRETSFTNPTEKQKYAAELYEYYVIGDITWDIEKATSNLKLVGDDRVPTAGYTEGPVSGLNYQVTFDEVSNELVFKNNSGSALAHSFVIYVPVTVGHKWGETTRVIAIDVKPATPVGE